MQRLCQYPLLFRSIATAYAGADGGAAHRRGSVAASCPRTGAEKAFYTLTVLEKAVADVNEGVRRTQAVVALRMRLGDEWVERLGPACTVLLEMDLSYVLREPEQPSGHGGGGGGGAIKQLLGGHGTAHPAAADRVGEATLYVLSDLVLLVAPDPPQAAP